MNFEEIMQIIGKWGGTLKFFPSDPDARIGIAEEIGEMASEADQVRWLVGRLPKLYQEWPAMHEVRAVFCSKFQPRDGIEVYSRTFPDGIPSEKQNLPALPAATPRQLPGDVLSAAASLHSTVTDLARAKDMNRTLRGLPAPLVRDIPTVQITAANRITPDQVEETLRLLHEQKARELVGK
jgi:hypothetical protein